MKIDRLIFYSFSYYNVLLFIHNRKERGYETKMHLILLLVLMLMEAKDSHTKILQLHTSADTYDEGLEQNSLENRDSGTSNDS